MFGGSYIWQICVGFIPFQPPQATILFPTSRTSAEYVGSSVSATRLESPVSMSIAKTIDEPFCIDLCFLYFPPMQYAVPHKTKTDNELLDRQEQRSIFCILPSRWAIPLFSEPSNDATHSSTPDFGKYSIKRYLPPCSVGSGPLKRMASGGTVIISKN